MQQCSSGNQRDYESGGFPQVLACHVLVHLLGCQYRAAKAPLPSENYRFLCNLGSNVVQQTTRTMEGRIATMRDNAPTESALPDGIDRASGSVRVRS